MRKMLAAFAWSIIPAYFLVGLFFKTRWTGRQRARDSGKMGFWRKVAFVLFMIIATVVVIIELKGIFVVIKDLIGDSFKALSEGDIRYSFDVFKKVFVSAANVNVVLEILSCIHPRIRVMFEKTLKFLKWALQHIMNLIAVMGLYYACYDRNSKQGNLLLLALTCEIYIVWFTRDIFEAASTRLHVDGFVLEVIYGAEANDTE